MLSLLAPSGCDRERAVDAQDGEALLVMAAASLSSAMPELIESFEGRTGISVDLSLGATGSLAAQLENGAPADLFFSADRSTVERLVGSRTLLPESVRDYAAGDLVLVWRRGVAPPESLAELTDDRFEVIAIPNPETAPYGAAAMQTLRAAGILEPLKARLVQSENVNQTYQLVRTGNADAALVARSVVDMLETGALLIDPDEYDPILQTAGIVVGGHLTWARSFLDFVLGPEGQKILASHGFRRAPTAPWQPVVEIPG